MKRKGFLLFEVMVAVIIASTVLVVLLQGMGNALRAGVVGKKYFKAMLLAEDLIGLLEKDQTHKKGVTSGRFSEKQDPEEIFKWTMDIQPVIFGRTSISEIPVSEAKITVEWTDVRGRRSIELSTYVRKDEETMGGR